MFVNVLLVQALFALCTAALPSARERLEQRIAKREDAMPKLRSRELVSDTSDVRLSKNWAGAVINSPAVRMQFSFPPQTQP